MERVKSSRIRQVIGDVEVVEATEPATIVVTEDDIMHGQPGDPRNCALALAARRTWGSDASIGFLRGVAYVTFTDRESRKRAERLIQSKRAKDMVKVFDSGGTPEPGSYQLHPPAPSQTVAGSYERAKRFRAKAKAEGRKIIHKPRGKLDPLSFKRAREFKAALKVVSSDG